MSRNVQQTNITCLWIFKLPATLQNWETSQAVDFQGEKFLRDARGKELGNLFSVLEG